MKIKWNKVKEEPYPENVSLLLCCKDWPPARIRGESPPVKVGGWDTELDGWRIFGASWTPTHWAELPDPPED